MGPRGISIASQPKRAPVRSFCTPACCPLQAGVLTPLRSARVTLIRHSRDAARFTASRSGDDTSIWIAWSRDLIGNHFTGPAHDRPACIARLDPCSFSGELRIRLNHLPSSRKETYHTIFPAPDGTRHQNRPLLAARASRGRPRLFSDRARISHYRGIDTAGEGGRGGLPSS